MAEDLIFVPQVGFRWASALGTKANVVLKRSGLTFIGGIAPDRDGCRLNFSLSGIQLPDDLGPMGRALEAPVRIHDDHGRDISKPRPRWFVSGRLQRPTDGAVTLHYGTVLEALAPDVRYVVLEFGGPAGKWRVELPVEPAQLTGIVGRPLEASDTT